MRSYTLSLLVLTAACSAVGEPGAPSEVSSVLASVSPPGGAVDVDPASTWVTLTFTHPMPAVMADYLAVREAAVTGPLVPGAWSLSEDGRTFTFVPDAPFAPATTYVIHVSGGLRDHEGRLVDLTPARDSCGGRFLADSMPGATRGPMSGRMARRGAPSDSTGVRGMIFVFTTAS